MARHSSCTAWLTQMTTPAFIVGSYAYGTPNEESDVDLVILADDATLALLASINDDPSPVNPEYSSVSLRFGKLNLLVCTDQAYYDVWQRGVEVLRAQAPVTREQAVEHFKKLRQEAKLE